jgi:hypothetical protein
MKSKLLPILILIICVMMFGCADWFGNDDDDDDTKGGGGGAAAAPNIYLYPETAGNISVKLTFTDVSSVFTHTDPEYADGWNVWVEPSGLIDDSYDYLYYAGELRSRFQLKEGWAVEEEIVFQWFEEIMLEMGFNQNETDDFIEYWVEHLPPSPCYHIYPQDTDLVGAHVAIDIEPVPDTLERMWFYIDKTDHCEALLEPEGVVPFEREGFTVIEWGVFMPFE